MYTPLKFNITPEKKKHGWKTIFLLGWQKIWGYVELLVSIQGTKGSMPQKWYKACIEKNMQVNRIYLTIWNILSIR